MLTPPGAYPDLKIHNYGSRSTGVRHEAYWQEVQGEVVFLQLELLMFQCTTEMIPELIVPDLDDCNLKPYVSYKTKEINQEELTSR